MAKILVFNNYSNRMEVYYKGLMEAMPYNSGRTLTVKEFKGASGSDIVWTDRRAMEAWNSFRYIYGKPIYVGYAFRRPWEGGHGLFSQHYAGLAFDVGQNLDSSGRINLHNSAVNSGIWNYVEPLYETPSWVHFDERQVASGYPLIKQGTRGVYVCIAQDALMTLGYNTGGLDGIFGTKTMTAVRQFQAKSGLPQDGIIGKLTWNALMNSVVGKGATDGSILA